MEQLMVLGIPDKDEARFWNKVKRNPNNGCWEWTAATQKGYGVFWWEQRLQRAHRVMAICCGMDREMHVDHICFNPRCVNPSHLRPVTHKQNHEHRQGADSDNKSTGIRGVSFRKDRNKFRAYVKHEQRMVHLGYFDTVEEADRAAHAGRDQYFTHH